MTITTTTMARVPPTPPATAYTRMLSEEVSVTYVYAVTVVIPLLFLVITSSGSPDWAA